MAPVYPLRRDTRARLVWPAGLQHLQRHFHITAVRPDGETSTWHRTGGSAIDHALDAQEWAGLGGVVRVIPLELEPAP